MATTEYADFSIRGKKRLTFNQTVQKTGQVHPCQDITGVVMALWKASILLHLDFWGFK
jgi:hypothetical protein